MRFGRSAPRDEQPAAPIEHHELPPALPEALGQPVERELLVRRAQKDGRLVAVLRAVDRGGECVVEAEVYPNGSAELVRPGPYTFQDQRQASAFMTEAVSALMYLGCDVQA